LQVAQNISKNNRFQGKKTVKSTRTVTEQRVQSLYLALSSGRGAQTLVVFDAPLAHIHCFSRLPTEYNYLYFIFFFVKKALHINSFCQHYEFDTFETLLWSKIAARLHHLCPWTILLRNGT
jgi:hypothetical protein